MPTPTPQISTGLKSKFGYRPFQSVDATAYTFCSTLSNFDPPTDSFDKVEGTILSSPQKQYGRGLSDVEMNFTIRKDFGDTAFASIRADLVKDNTKPLWDFIILWSDGSKDKFDGFVSEWKPASVTVSDAQTVDVTVTVNNGPDFTPAPTS